MSHRLASAGPHLTMRTAITTIILFLASRLLALVFAVLLVMAASGAQAQTVGLHLGSWHSAPGFNNVNPGLYLRTADGWTLGAYRNSYRVTTAYAGRTWETAGDGLRVSVTAGLATGYAHPWLVAPSASIPLGPVRARIVVIPGIGQGQASAAHLTVETTLP